MQDKSLITMKYPRRSSVVWLMMAGLTFGSGGCQTAAKLKSRTIAKPVVRVGEVRLVEQTSEGARVRATVELKNPNDVALPLSRHQFSITIWLKSGDHTFEYADQPRRTLPAQGKQDLKLIAAFDTDGQPVDAVFYSVNGTIEYQPPGQVRRLLTDLRVPRPSVEYTATGRLKSLPANRDRQP